MTMTQSDIRYVFDRVFNGAKNFMTPHVLKYGKRGPMLWELSTGDGIERGSKIFGVTVIERGKGGNIHRHDKSAKFDTQADAESYITSDFTERETV